MNAPDTGPSPRTRTGAASATGRAALFAYMLAALAMVFWSGNWVVGRAVRGDIPPLTLNFLRWTVAALVLVPFAWKDIAADWPLARKHWKYVITLGITGAALFHSMIYIGLRSTEAINALLLNSMSPIYIIVLSWVTFRDRISLRQFIGISISLFGAIVLVSRGDFATLAELDFNRGDIWVFLALTVWAVYSITLKRRPEGFGGISMAFYMCLAASVLMLPVWIGEFIAGARMSLTVQNMASVAYTGIFASVLGYQCYNAAVHRIGPTRAGIFLHLMPVFGSIFAIAFLGENLFAYHLTGFAVVLIGITISSTGKRLA